MRVLFLGAGMWFTNVTAPLYRSFVLRQVVYSPPPSSSCFSPCILPLNSPPSANADSIRFTAMSKYSSDSSTPMNLRPELVLGVLPLTYAHFT